MIYLIQDCYKNDKGEYIDILKIGYSEKPFMESRNNQYKTHNYGYKFLGEREGDTIIEELFHEKYSSFSLNPYTEWMLYDDEIVDGFFNLSEEDLIDNKNIEVPEIIEKEVLIKNLQKDLVSYSFDYLYSTNKNSLIEEFKEYTRDENEITEGLRSFRDSLNRELLEINSLPSIKENPFIKALPDIINISLDLPQILGRQRLKENVFRNEVLILYKSENKKGAIINESKLVNDEKVKIKEEETKRLLEGYQGMTEEQKLSWAFKAKRDKDLYKSDYVGVSSRTGLAMFNYLVKIADQRAYDVTRKDYIDDITIRRGIESLENVNVEVIEGNIENELQGVYNYLIQEFDKDKDFVRRMKLLCDINFQYPTFFQSYSTSPLQCIIPIEYQNYINLLGFEKIRTLGYRESDIVSCIQSQQNLQNSNITSLFSIGSKYTKKQIKEMLRKFYEENNIIKTPKASDLEEYFNLKTCKIKIDDKWEHGFEIISLKEEGI